MRRAFAEQMCKSNRDPEEIISSISHNYVSYYTYIFKTTDNFASLLFTQDTKGKNDDFTIFKTWPTRHVNQQHIKWHQV